MIYSPGATNFDSCLIKNYRTRKIRESGDPQLRFEGFNILNHPQFGPPNANISTRGAGAITALTTMMGQLQAGMRLVFWRLVSSAQFVIRRGG